MTGHTPIRFVGFSARREPLVALPELVFTDLIPAVGDLDELKVTLLVLWRLARMRSNVAPWITQAELRADPHIRQALAGGDFNERLMRALEAAVERGTLLTVSWGAADGTTEVRYFANSPRGRAAVAAVRRGVSPERSIEEERPDIFTLYEQNIGPLTALLSEDLMDAEETYPASWIEEAFREAVRLNKRNWKYIRAILERWRSEGRDEINRGIDRQAGGRARGADARRYIEEHYDKIVRH